MLGLHKALVVVPLLHAAGQDKSIAPYRSSFVCCLFVVRAKRKRMIDPAKSRKGNLPGRKRRNNRHTKSASLKQPFLPLCVRVHEKKEGRHTSGLYTKVWSCVFSMVVAVCVWRGKHGVDHKNLWIDDRCCCGNQRGRGTLNRLHRFGNPIRHIQLHNDNNISSLFFFFFFVVFYFILFYFSRQLSFGLAFWCGENPKRDGSKWSTSGRAFFFF